MNMICAKDFISLVFTFVSGCSSNYYAQVASVVPNAGGLKIEMYKENKIKQ